MTKSEVLKRSSAEMNRRFKAYIDVAWFIEDNSDEQLETILALRQLELEGMIRVTSRAPYNIISCFMLT